MIRVPGRAFLSFILAAVALAVYARSLSAGFVGDATSKVLISDYIHQPRNFLDLLSLRVLHRDVLDNNRPVNLLSLMLDSLVWGRRPVGYHLTNLLLHAATAVFVFLFCDRMLREEAGLPADGRLRAAAFLAALLFAVHPVDVEAVSEVSYREDLLVAFFGFSGLHLAAYFHPAQGKKGTALLAGTTLCFLLAVGAKENGIMCPFALILFFLLFRKSEFGPGWTWFLVLPTLAVGGFLAARFSLQPKNSVIFTSAPTYPGGSFLDALLVQPRIWAFYFRQIVFPVDLCADYGPYSVRNFELGVSILSLVAALLFQGLLSTRWKLFCLGVGIFWLSLLPVSNFIPIYRPMADRFLYVPMTGVALMLASLFARGSSAVSWRLIGAGSLAAAGILATLSVDRQSVWHDSLSLWMDTARANPASFQAADNLGFALLNAGQPARAFESFSRAVRMADSGRADPFAGIALAMESLHRPSDADAAFKKAVALDPRYSHPESLREALIWEEANVQKLRPIAQRNTP